ncbi:hypothetical protein [Pararobbsia silviterrae]|uniref:N-acetyltransferase domain-containing protein n=1 Tax=Pararobbsia silviterrae TaxID=1792498 RepID=A0A494Y270_9BURK|nr:hypothetical protein [Pararobbsia silviterrae]RKP56359.1 hypothetical protein D7S86_08140 [Pararobbsia silviterrae]
MLYGIQIAEIDAVWPEVRPWIEQACARNRGKYDADDILAGLLTGEDQLWIWKSPTAFAVGITRLANYPKQRVCTIRIVTGLNAAEWQDEAMATIERWAKENGCHAMELCARPGWARRMRSHGFDMTHVYIEKKL